MHKSFIPTDRPLHLSEAIIVEQLSELIDNLDLDHCHDKRTFSLDEIVTNSLNSEFILKTKLNDAITIIKQLKEKNNSLRIKLEHGNSK